MSRRGNDVAALSFKIRIGILIQVAIDFCCFPIASVSRSQNSVRETAGSPKVSVLCTKGRQPAQAFARVEFRAMRNRLIAGVHMEKENQKHIEQPQPFTPGISKAQVRQHAFELYQDKLRHNESLTLEDWVLAEKDLVQMQQTEG
jgi:hypothetical protein